MMVPENVLDGVVGGHVHTIVHHWVNNIPVIIADSYSKNLNALYLTYDKLNRKIIKENIEMEVYISKNNLYLVLNKGPIPICSKIFEEEKICNIPVG
jgi:2',3'-cyclic-nucleotide 2'-phosphodiesterase (5'-nucleotidase family)